MSVLFYCEECGVSVIPDEVSEDGMERAERGIFLHDLCWAKSSIRQIIREAVLFDLPWIEPTVEKIMTVIEKLP